MKHTGSAKNVNPKDIAKLGGSSFILGSLLKAMESLGEGINNSLILLYNTKQYNYHFLNDDIYIDIYLLVCPKS